MSVKYQIYFFYLAAIGWSLSLVVHLLALAGVDASETVSATWLLHIGIFAVWIPAILTLRSRSDGQSAMRKYGIFGLLTTAPFWLRAVAALGLAYAVLNFLLFMGGQPGSPTAANGVYSLQNHGTIVKVLTESEYYRYKANEVRGFSGHWMAFYGFAAAVLYPFNINKNTVQ